ncbi:Protein-cysteine N-palmitoyltransferase Rasp [Toxocara canis]|uniref:Protein-cysteine N-palmitoyltransferase Rasp n=1 Tax=Toxocara canis TaxID=6265 RepID=A0A0B2VFQ2_TOXCA|nr:Protein-cysteine N-palmitoyltransferase Rasp [Toxocara canis]
MWRNFDRGLYQFLKNQVYLPLMGDLNGAYLGWRRFGAMVGAFVFVLAWHGTSSNYVCWVVLSGCELCIERIGYAIASTSAWSKMSMVIGRRNQRRLIAFAMLATVIPGIFGVFFFLGRDGFGKLVFKKVLMDGAIDVLHLRISLKNRSASAGLVFVHLIAVGYCFNQVCLQLDESINKEEHVRDAEKKTE